MKQLKMLLLSIMVMLFTACGGKHNIPSGPTMQVVAIKYDVAMVLGDKYSMHKKAENGFREVVQLAPFFAEAHYNLGIALAHQSKWNDALSQFNSALMFNSNFELALIAKDRTQRILDGREQSKDIKIPRYCRIFHKLYELGC